MGGVGGWGGGGGVGGGTGAITTTPTYRRSFRKVKKIALGMADSPQAAHFRVTYEFAKWRNFHSLSATYGKFHDASTAPSVDIIDWRKHFIPVGPYFKKDMGGRNSIIPPTAKCGFLPINREKSIRRNVANFTFRDAKNALLPSSKI